MDCAIGIVTYSRGLSPEDQIKLIRQVCGEDTDIHVLLDTHISDITARLYTLFSDHPTIIVTSLSKLSSRWNELRDILHAIAEIGFALKIIHDERLVDVDIRMNENSAGVTMEIRVTGVDWLHGITMPGQTEDLTLQN